jgi:pimeloyl-ACP methyl ester carboxylesterase
VSDEHSELAGPRRQGFFNSRDGTPIFYEISGQGRPLIFCYGLVCRRDHWRHQIRHFSRDYQIITFDYRGHHRSGTPQNDQNITLEWCAKDVQDLIHFLDLKEAVCFGHSMGVPVCTLLSLLEPERVKGVVLICGSVSNPFHGMFFTDRMDRVYKWSSKLYEFAPQAMTVIWRRFTEINRLNVFFTYHLGFNPYLAEEEDVLGYMEGVNQIPISTFFSLLKDYTAHDGRPQLREMKCPALVIAGREDCITPMELQEEMARLIPQGELEKMAHGSHNAHMDLPDLVNGSIESFLRRIHYR